MAVPLWLRDHLLGIVTFGRSISPRRYDADDLRVAEDVARRAAIAVDHARLYRDSEQRRQETEALVEISRTLTSTLDRETVGRRIVDSLRALLGAHMAALGRAEPHGLVPIAVSGDVGPGLTGIGAGPLTSGAIGLALQTGQTVVTADMLSDPRLHYSPELRQRVASAPYRAALVVPLRVQQRVIGILFVGDRLGRVFGERDLRVALTFAEHAAVALHNAELYREAQEASRAKDEFLAVVSHELRTPLNAIFGWARMLRAGRLDAEDVPRALEVIERNAVTQEQLINDLLDISRIITRRMRLDLRPVDVTGIVETAVDSVRPAAEAKGIAIGSSVNLAVGSADLVVMADPERLRQVVGNLLQNAVKFTPPGGVVELELRRGHADVEIVVRDTGQGIPPAALPHVFEHFWQRDSSSTRAHGGLGIGLALVHHLVDLHGGTVRAESAGEGAGATFVVQLPLSLGEVPSGARLEPAAPARGSLRGRRVLVVDDDPDARDLLVAVLSTAGAEVTASGSVADCLAAFERARPHVVVADIAMPGEDGYALLTRLRSRRPDPDRAVPVVAVTARSRHEDRARALAAGFDMHFVKPIDPAELAAAVATLADRAG